MTISFCQFLGCLVPALPRTKWSRFTSATLLTATASKSSISTLTESPESSRGQSSVAVLWSMASYVKILFDTCCPLEAFLSSVVECFAPWVQFQLCGFNSSCVVGFLSFYLFIDTNKQLPPRRANLMMFLEKKCMSSLCG